MPFGSSPGAGETVATAPVPADVELALTRLRQADPDALFGVIFFGSRLVASSPDRFSAADLFVITDDPGRLYEGLREQGLVRRSPRVLAALNHWLTPNVVSLRHPDDEGAGAKCFVLDTTQFERELSPRAKDYFCRGRLAHRVQVVLARDAQADARIREWIAGARRDALAWVPLYLPERFTVEDFCLRMLGVSFGSEIRPEAAGRVREVFLAQRAFMETTYGEVLRRHGPARGIVEDTEGRFHRLAAPSRGDVWRWRWAFRRSSVRATLRWTKYMLTFDDWLEYIVRKLNRRTGLGIELTDAERRWPFVLLWPKFFRVLGALRDERRRGTDRGGRA